MLSRSAAEHNRLLRRSVLCRLSKSWSSKARRACKRWPQRRWRRWTLLLSRSSCMLVLRRQGSQQGQRGRVLGTMSRGSAEQSMTSFDGRLTRSCVSCERLNAVASQRARRVASGILCHISLRWDASSTLSQRHCQQAPARQHRLLQPGPLSSCTADTWLHDIASCRLHALAGLGRHLTEQHRCVSLLGGTLSRRVADEILKLPFEVYIEHPSAQYRFSLVSHGQATA